MRNPRIRRSGIERTYIRNGAVAIPSGWEETGGLGTIAWSIFASAVAIAVVSVPLCFRLEKFGCFSFENQKVHAHFLDWDDVGACVKPQMSAIKRLHTPNTFSPLVTRRLQHHVIARPRAPTDDRISSLG